MSWSFPRLTRRGFLQVTGGAAGMTLLKPSEWIDNAEAETETREEQTYSICNFCSSLCNIKATTRTEHGVKRVVKLDGNPHSTLNRGKICARGQAGVRQIYDVDRIKSPLIRVEGSKRGEARFRAVSWDEAWAYIDNKSKQAQIQPWEWTMVGGWTSCVFYMYWAVPFAIGNGVPNIVASPMQHCVTSGHLGTDTVTGNFNIHDEVLPDYENADYILFVANNASIGAVSTPRMVRFAMAKKKGAKVVAIDVRLSETASKANEWLMIRPGTDLDFMTAMMHVIISDRLYDTEFLVRHTNMPFLVTQGEDGQWQLAMDEKGNPQVVNEYTGKLVSLPSFSNSNLIDIDGKPAYPSLFAPDDMQINDQPVMTVLQAQMAEIAKNTPEWAEKTTGISAHTIRRIAKEFARAGRPIVDPGWHGARYGNIIMLRRVQAMVQALVGGIDCEGGWTLAGEYRHKISNWHEAKAQGKKYPGPLMTTMAGVPFMMELVKAIADPRTFSHGKPAWSFAFSGQERAAGREYVTVPALSDVGLLESVQGKLEYNGEPYKSRAIVINAANPVRHYYPDTHWKEILSHENVELVVAVDVLPSDTIPYCDVILPNPTYLERDEPALYGNGVNPDLAITTRFKAIEPLHDTLETPDILLHLSEIISGSTVPFLETLSQLSGISREETMKYYELFKKQGVNSPYSKACRVVAFNNTAKKQHISVEELEDKLRKRGVLIEERIEDMVKHHSMPRHMAVPTSSGRIEFFATLVQGLQGMGGKGPEFNLLAASFPSKCRTNASMSDPLGKDEFYFTYGKVPTVSYGSTNSNNPVLAGINRFKHDIYTGVWIHPNRAEQLGIKSGDSIRMTNNASNQQATGHAYITRQVHPDAIFLHSSFGIENKALRLSYGLGTAINKLIPYFVEPMVAGFRSQEFTIRVEKVRGGDSV